ncbi:MAG: hypothetical protein ACTS5P_00835 [Candidatus Hodgkinia cicadicola]
MSSVNLPKGFHSNVQRALRSLLTWADATTNVSKFVQVSIKLFSCMVNAVQLFEGGKVKFISSKLPFKVIN